MPRQLSTRLLVFALVATLGAARIASGFSHHGKVVDAATKQPIEYVFARAATSDKIAERGDCPKYDGFLGQAQTRGDGSFTLKLPNTAELYFVTYCRAQYEVFTPDEPSENRKEGTAVIPAPVRLWRVDGGASQMRASLEVLRTDTRNAIAALRQSNPEALDRAMKSLPDAERRLVNTWVADAAAQRRGRANEIELVAYVQPAAGSNVEAVQALLKQALASQRVTLKYLEKASPAHFATQIQQFPDLNGYVNPKPLARTPKPARPAPAPIVVPAPPAVDECDVTRNRVAAARDYAAKKAETKEISIPWLLQIDRAESIDLSTPRTRAESHLYRVSAFLYDAKRGEDGSITLLLYHDDEYRGLLTAVIPTKCVADSEFADDIGRSRLLLETLPIEAIRNHRIAVWGFGFFQPDTHKSKQIELRPLIRIQLHSQREPGGPVLDSRDLPSWLGR